MTDGDALLAAVIANPDEDTPRLVYADWLQENGQPERAEFIRLQCAPELDETSKGRAFELEEQYRSEWLGLLPQRSAFECEFRRGFPEHLVAHYTQLLEHYDAVARLVWVRSLCLTGLDTSAIYRLVARPWNLRWIELELQAHTRLHGVLPARESAPSVITVATCPQIAQLRRLRFSYFEMNADGIHALASSPYLNNIQQLCLDCITNYASLSSLSARFGDRLVIG
jgi:uncharacterized protein (TIGR02996 family)